VTLAGQIGMDDALARVQHTRWQRNVRRAVLTLCRADITFTAETVREMAGDPPGAPNAMGAALHALAEEGLIVEVGSTRSKRPEARGRRVLVWRGA
jgi:hypothetical protein